MVRIVSIAGIEDVSGNYEPYKVVYTLKEKGLSNRGDKVEGYLPVDDERLVEISYYTAERPFFGVFGYLMDGELLATRVPLAVEGLNSAFPEIRLRYCGFGSENIHDGREMKPTWANEELDDEMSALVSSAQALCDIKSKYSCIGLREALDLVDEPLPEGLIAMVESAVMSGS